MYGGLFCYLMKILCNKKGFHERSVLRNVIFDCIRCLTRPILFPLIFEENINYQNILYLAFGTIIMSICATLFLRKPIFEKLPLVWGWLNIEFMLMFTESLLYVFNAVEKVYNGNILILSFATLMEI